MNNELKRIYLHPATKERLANIMPKSITYDWFIQCVLNYLKTTGLTVEDLLQYAPDENVPMEIEELTS